MLHAFGSDTDISAAPHVGLALQSPQDQSPGTVTGSVTVRSAPCVTYRHLANFADFPRWAPILQKVKVEHQSTERARVFFDGALGFGPLAIRLRFRCDLRLEPERQIVMERYLDGDFEHLEFTHTLEPTAHGTRLTSSYLFGLESLSVLGQKPLKQRPWAVRPIQYGLVALMLNGFAHHVHGTRS